MRKTSDEDPVEVPADLELNHPHDFFGVRERAVVPDTCFVLMPFKDEFFPAYAAIKATLEEHGMTCQRSDTARYTGTVLYQVMQSISSAELIVADLTGGNANVFYELGLAHVRTKDVVLIVQNSASNLPFNLKNMNCIPYCMSELSKLQDSIRNAARDVQARRIPTALKNRKERTEQIVKRLKSLQQRSLHGCVIRQQSAMSSFGNEDPSPGDSPERHAYLESLTEERDEMIACVRGGAAVELIMAPLVARPFAEKRWRRRVGKLLEFLDQEAPFMDNVDIALLPYTTENLLFINEEILFEGHKTRVLEGGFPVTFVYTNREHIVSRSYIFTTLLKSARTYAQDFLNCGQSSTERRLALVRYLETELKRIP